MIPRLLAATAACLLIACHPTALPGEGSVSIQVGKRADQLTYAAGATTPYTGEIVTFAQSGIRVLSQTFLEGNAHGSWVHFWPTGKIKREEVWENGVQVHQRQWYANGILKEEVPMKNSRACGTVRFWWPDGRLRRMAYMERALTPHGHVLEYAEDGTVLVDAIFEHGVYLSGLRLNQELTTVTTARIN